ncbi:MAG: OpgC domain-containing protein [Methylococcales bacterium]
MKFFDPTNLAYPEGSSGRDLRIDFLRGMVMMVVIVVHLEFASLLGMFAWGRVGLISSAEGFVGLSGLVAGIVYRRKAEKNGFRTTAKQLFKRAFLLYRVNVVVILSIAVLALFPFIDVNELTHWSSVDGKGPVFDLYPPQHTPWTRVIIQALLLEIGPHQFQVIGLYVVMLALAPLFLYLMVQRKTFYLLALSWALYVVSQVHPIRLTGARFEYGFPLLNWQLLFINSMVAGHHLEKIAAWFQARNARPILITCMLMVLTFLVLANNREHPTFWPGPQFSLIPAQLVTTWDHLYFQKGSLGFGRVLNNLVIYIIAYYLLTRYWRLFERGLGWLLIPVGQASLYVFITHIYVILMVYNTPLPGYDNFFINTLVHVFAILAIWWMVKRKFLFTLVPR